MFKKYIVFSLAVILLLIPARAYAVEEAEIDSSEQETTNEIYYEEPYIEPVEEELYIQPWAEEPYVEPEEEPYVEPYIEPWYDDTYETPADYNNQNDNYNAPSVTYEEPYVEETEEQESYVEPETGMPPEPAELSISSVVSETYNVSGTVAGDAGIVEGVRLTLSNGNEKMETSSDEDGTFIFNDVSNGTYNLSAEESKDYEVTSGPIEVNVDDRNKLGYEITVAAIEVQVLENEEDLPIESAETDERAEETEGTAISGFELSLIVIATILLLITIAIVLFRKFSRR